MREYRPPPLVIPHEAFDRVKRADAGSRGLGAILRFCEKGKSVQPAAYAASQLRQGTLGPESSSRSTRDFVRDDEERDSGLSLLCLLPQSFHLIKRSGLGRLTALPQGVLDKAEATLKLSVGLAQGALWINI